MRVFERLPVGQYTFRATLFGGSIANPVVVDGLNAVVPAGGQAQVGLQFHVTFTAPVGSATFRWTVSNPNQCLGATVLIESTATPAGVAALQASLDCAAPQLQIDSLSVGPYTFKATLFGGPVAVPVVVDRIQVTVVAGVVTDVPAFTFTVGGQ
jgi:hypothetical protein